MQWIMAPMAGVSDSVFRRIVRRTGADVTVSEMVSSRGIHYKDAKTGLLMAASPAEHPFLIQIFGNDPSLMAEAARAAEAAGADGVDINMGCPMPKIVNNGDGGALMKDPALAARVTEAAAGAVKIPVSVKFRAGWDEEHRNAPAFARILEQSGAASLCLHPRTVRQLYTGKADPAIFAEAAKTVHIPLIYSGDIKDLASAKTALAAGASSLMIGRAAMGDPWIFRRLAAELRGETPERIGAERRMAAALCHARLLCAQKGERTGVSESRKFAAFYVRGIPDAAAVRNAVCRAEKLDTLEEIFSRYLTREWTEEEIF